MKKYFTLALLALVTSCTKTPSTHFQDKKQLNVNYNNEPSTLDPRKGAEYVSSSMHFFLYEGLTRMTPQETAAPAIAEKIDITEDGLTYTFHIRDCKWSNGSPVTSYDFKQTWLDMLSPDFACPNAHLLYPILGGADAKHGKIPLEAVGIEAPDAKTLVVHLENPTPYFLELVAFCVFSPVNQEVVKRDSSWADDVGPNLIGNGPYRLVKWRHGAEMVLEKNTDYWDAEHIRLEKIHISFVDNEMTALQMYENGELDLIGLPFTNIPPDSIPSYKERGLIKTHPFAASTVTFFNTDVFPFNNKNIRKAFAYAIHRQEIVDNITQLDEQVSTDTVPSVLKNMQAYSFFRDGDENQAREFFAKGLDELGITKEELGTLHFTHASTDIFPKIAQALQEQWRKALGVDVALHAFEYRVFLDKLVKRDYQFSLSRWVAQYNDQMNILDRFALRDSPKNYCGWFNESFTQILNQSTKIRSNEQRYGYLMQAEAIIASEMPFTVLYHWNNVYLKQPYIRDLYIYPTGGFHLHDIHFE